MPCASHANSVQRRTCTRISHQWDEGLTGICDNLALYGRTCFTLPDSLPAEAVGELTYMPWDPTGLWPRGTEGPEYPGGEAWLGLRNSLHGLCCPREETPGCLIPGGAEAPGSLVRTDDARLTPAPPHSPHPPPPPPASPGQGRWAFALLSTLSPGGQLPE